MRTAGTVMFVLANDEDQDDYDYDEADWWAWQASNVHACA